MLSLNFSKSPCHKKMVPNTLRATFDGTNLYGNLFHELGKQAISFWFDKYPDTLHPRFSKKMIIQGIDITLHNNSF